MQILSPKESGDGDRQLYLQKGKRKEKRGTRFCKATPGFVNNTTRDNVQILVFYFYCRW